MQVPRNEFIGISEGAKNNCKTHDCMVTLYLTVWETARLFSNVVALFYIPPAVYESSDWCNDILANTVYHMTFWL